MTTVESAIDKKDELINTERYWRGELSDDQLKTVLLCDHEKYASYAINRVHRIVEHCETWQELKTALIESKAKADIRKIAYDNFKIKIGD